MDAAPVALTDAGAGRRFASLDFIRGISVLGILARFRFGPLEWMWRCLAYWRLFPLKR